MKTTRSIILALALFLAFAGTALAMSHGKAADLSPEKQALIDKAHDDFAVSTADLKRQIFAKESALNAELYGDKTDDKKVEAVVAEINALHGKIYSEKVKIRRIMAKEGILPGKGHAMMGGGDCPMMGEGGCSMMGEGGCPMMGGMKGGHGEKHGQKHGKADYAAPEVTTEANAPGGHDAHAPAKQ